jgi:anti-anti-sigma factor
MYKVAVSERGETVEPSLLVEATPTGPAAVCLTVSGELDAHSAGVLAELVRATLSREHPVAIRIDLGLVDFIDVAGVRTLYDLQFDAAATGCALTVTDAPRTTRRILQVLGLEDLIAMPTTRRPLTEPGS